MEQLIEFLVAQGVSLNDAVKTIMRDEHIDGRALSGLALADLRDIKIPLRVAKAMLEEVPK